MEINNSLKTFSEILYQIYNNIYSSDNWNNVFDCLNSVMHYDSIAVAFHDNITGKPKSCITRMISEDIFENYKSRFYDKENFRIKAMSAGINVYSPQDIIGSRSWINSDFYNELLSGQKGMEMLFLDSVVDKNIAIRLSFANYDGTEFTDKDKNFMKLLLPHISRAYAQMRQLKKIDEPISVYDAVIREIDHPCVIFDLNFNAIHINKPAVDLCDEKNQNIDQLIEKLSDFLHEMINYELSDRLIFNNSLESTIFIWNTNYKIYHLRIDPPDAPSFYVVSIEDTSYWISRAISKYAVLNSLSERECEICIMIIKGFTNRKIAESLYISEYTVKDHLSSIMFKLNVKSRSMVIAKILGII